MDAFPIIGNWLTWKLGDGKNIKLELDPWVGGESLYSLSQGLRHSLNSQVFSTLGNCGGIGHTLAGNQRWVIVTILGLENDLK